MLPHSVLYFILDCIADVINIIVPIGWWARFIEPKLLKKQDYYLSFEKFPQELKELKIAHISDIHWTYHYGCYPLKRALKIIEKEKPDLIFFTGDLGCYANLESPSRLKKLFKNIDAPLGCYWVPGNHDYEYYVSSSKNGIVRSKNPPHFLVKVFQKIFGKTHNLTKSCDDNTPLEINHRVDRVMKDLGFQLLNNTSNTISIKNSLITIVGIGDKWTQQENPELAFKNTSDYFTIALAHNPDSFYNLKNYEWNLLLCGHTHGGQVNIPFFVRKFQTIQNSNFIRGLCKIGERYVHTSAGLGGPYPFRMYAKPEVTFIHLKNH